MTKYAIALIALCAVSACSQSTEDEGDSYIDERAGDLVPTPAANMASGIPDRAVMVGYDGPQMDACGTSGRVVVLDAEDGTPQMAPVRSAPFEGAKEVDTLPDGKQLIICEIESGWLGIVYPQGDEPDCGTGSPISHITSYTGPCRSGWVSESYAVMEAG